MAWPNAAQRTAFIRTFMLAFAWLLVVRVILIIQSGVVPSMPGMLGGDLAGAFLLAVLLQITRGVARPFLVVALGCALYVGGMHLTAHGTLFRLALAGKGMDSTFISGSLINLYLLTLPGYLALAWLLHALHRRWVSDRTPLLPMAGGSAAVMTAYLLLFPSLTTPANNIVAGTLSQVPGVFVTPMGIALSDEALDMDPNLEKRTHFFLQEARAYTPATEPNVLVIMIEGLSGGYLPGVSQYHDLEPIVELGGLEQTLEQMDFRTYRNVLSMERQTDRGTFALTCGRYPDLRRASEKVIAVAEKRANPDCLPEKLRTQGYHTAYWQAAPIEYMKKDEFLPLAGYEEVTGSEVFAAEGEPEGWGPPDPVFFPNVAQRLRELNRRHQPWFVTTLNVGTHHPFDIGEAAEAAMEQTSEVTAAIEGAELPSPQVARQRAMKTMAQSLSEFLAELEQDGLLDNTLVVLTSDESGGFVRQDNETTPLNNNFGVLAIRPPANMAQDELASETRLVAQLDVPLTILDATGHAHAAGNLIGRSLLVREPDSVRDLILADTYTGMKYFLRESGQLLACTEMMTRCQSWSFNPQRLFGSLTLNEDEPFLELDDRLALVETANNLGIAKP